jgi:glutamate 5-kinase
MVMEMHSREVLRDKHRIVVKVGTSSLSFPNGRMNLYNIRKLAGVLSRVRKQGKEVILVSSGAIGVGAGILGLESRPRRLPEKQALAAVGQAELMKIYQKFFDENDQLIAQVLLTKDVVSINERNRNARNTLLKLLDMNIIPIINENDTIAINEIVFGDNDTLSAIVATLVDADLLIMLSDIDGLYDADPKTDSNARIIHSVEHITPAVVQLASGAGSSFSTGGMITKISAAGMCLNNGIDCLITNGADPAVIFDLLEGRELGTHFVANSNKLIYNGQDT